MSNGKDRLDHPMHTGNHDAGGRFAKGNRAARGHGAPHASAVQRLRGAMLKAVTAADIAAILERLVRLAKGGDVGAAREVLDRCLGKAAASMTLTAELEGETSNVLIVLPPKDGCSASDKPAGLGPSERVRRPVRRPERPEPPAEPPDGGDDGQDEGDDGDFGGLLP